MYVFKQTFRKLYGQITWEFLGFRVSFLDSGYHFYMDTNIEGGFQICISVPLMYNNFKMIKETKAIKFTIS